MIPFASSNPLSFNWFLYLEKRNRNNGIWQIRKHNEPGTVAIQPKANDQQQQQQPQQQQPQQNQPRGDNKPRSNTAPKQQQQQQQPQPQQSQESQQQQQSRQNNPNKGGNSRRGGNRDGGGGGNRGGGGGQVKIYAPKAVAVNNGTFVSTFQMIITDDGMNSTD